MQFKAIVIAHNSHRQFHISRCKIDLLIYLSCWIFLILAPRFLRFTSFRSRRLLIYFIIRGAEKFSMKYISDVRVSVYVHAHAYIT